MKKILVLAFVSAAFFFGCSADDSFSSDTAPPSWSGEPSLNPSGGEQPIEPPPSGGNGNYCYVFGVCIELDEDFPATYCQLSGGQLVTSCASYY